MPIEFGSFSIGTVVGGAVVGLVNHFLSKSRSVEDRRIKEFNNAAADFRNAFTREIRLLGKSDTNPQSIVLESFALHENAPSYLGSDQDKHLKTEIIMVKTYRFITLECCF